MEWHAEFSHQPGTLLLTLGYISYPGAPTFSFGGLCLWLNPSSPLAPPWSARSHTHPGVTNTWVDSETKGTFVTNGKGTLIGM